MKVDILIAGATIITMDADRRIITDGALAIVGDRIAAIGKRADIEPAVEATETIDGRRFVLTPGFVNSHVHLTETLLKGFKPEDTEFGESVWRWTVPLYEAHTPEDQCIGTELAALSMLRTGTTTFLEAGTIMALDPVVETVRRTGLRGRVGAWMLDRAFSPDQDQTKLTDTAIRTLEDQMARYPATDGAKVAAWPFLIGHSTATDTLWRAAKDIADRYGAGVTAHMSPAETDPDWYLKNTGRRPILHLADIGVLGPNVALTHMVHVDKDEVVALAATGAGVIHCPGAAMKGGYGASKVGLHPEMAAAGVPLMTGTDGGDQHDMIKVMSLMAGLFKDARADNGIFSAYQVLEMATVGGAKFMGLQDQIGSLEVGKKADLVLHDTDRPEWRPMLNPVATLVWSADGRGVHSVWIGGQRVVDDYRCTTIDEEALYARAQSAAEAIVARSGLPTISPWPVI
ncbi:MAG TPA: amidohydrolase family protein [Alphaproteobacteria bacterium]|nr:amidohydrolase family protein [Alphaproteobacteria bacterium]